MPKSRKSKIVIPAVLLCLGAYLALNMNVSITQGIDGRLRRIDMPLYAKATEFLARHFEYARIAKEVTAGCRTDEDKVLAILKWTHKNIRRVPPGMPVVDDHILNIIIRGYGAPDQYEDVFTNLCAYCGIPAFWTKVYANDALHGYPISFVKISGKWRVFDAYLEKYFRNRNGEIASVEDVVKDRSLISGSELDDPDIGGIPYKEYYHNLEPVMLNRTLRAEKQMPIKRIIFEIKAVLGLERR